MRKWRVGSISTGVLFIALGGLLLGKQFWDVPVDRLLLNWWPIILILLGIEVLLYHLLRKDSPLQFDFFSMFILFIAFIFSLGLYTVQSSGIFTAVQNVVSSDRYNVDLNKTLDIPDGVKEVLVDIPNGEVEITGSPKKTLNVTGTLKLSTTDREEAEKKAENLFTVKIVGSQAIIQLEENHSTAWIGNQGLDAHLAITVPEGLQLQVKIMNGDTKIVGMKNSTLIEALNGDLVLEKNSGDIVAEMMNGKIIVDEAKGKLKLNTANGEINVRTSQVGGDWEIETMNGEIDLTLPKNTNAKIEAKSEIGSIDGTLNWTNKNDKKVVGDDKVATLGNGQHLITLEGKNGSIEVNVE